MQAYRTLEGGATARLTEKKSEFIAHACFVDTEAAALFFLNETRARHRTARHNVYAYVLRADSRERYSDDGEPAKTAGLPTLEVIRHAGLTDCIVVTTRYFGGTLLGTGGLVRAYTEAAKQALAAARQVEMQACVRGVLRVEYALYEQAANVLRGAGARVETPAFTEVVELPFVARDGTQEAFSEPLRALCRGKVALTLSAAYFAPFGEDPQ